MHETENPPMRANPRCPDCEADLEPGFVPDISYGSKSHSFYQTCWHPGTAEEQRFLGLRTGAVKIDKSAAIKLIAYRCPNFGLVRQYANR